MLLILILLSGCVSSPRTRKLEFEPGPEYDSVWFFQQRPAGVRQLSPREIDKVAGILTDRRNFGSSAMISMTEDMPYSFVFTFKGEFAFCFSPDIVGHSLGMYPWGMTAHPDAWSGIGMTNIANLCGEQAKKLGPVEEEELPPVIRQYLKALQKLAENAYLPACFFYGKTPPMRRFSEWGDTTTGISNKPSEVVR